MNLKKTGILYGKDLNDFMKNPGISVAALIPVLFVVLYRSIGLADAMGDYASYFLLNIGTVMSIAMVALLLVSTSVAEEKEKFTLRTLMMSNVRASEFLLSKILVTLTVLLMCNTLIFILSGSALSALPFYLLCCTLGSASLIMFSACIGIMARDQMSTSIYQIPIMLLVMLPAMLSEFNSFIGTLASLTPIAAMMNLFGNFQAGQLASAASLQALAVMLVWIAVPSLLFAWLYRRKGIDN